MAGETSTPGLIKNYIASGAIEPQSIVAFGAADGEVVQSSAATDLHIGVTDRVGPQANLRVDVIHSGIASVKAGGTITRGAIVTSDASGHAVAATGVQPGIGIAMASAVDNDIIPVLVMPQLNLGGT